MERQKNIIEFLKKRESVKVNELSEKFNVTKETIRRDLDTLDKQNKIVRTHGGAIYTAFDELKEIPYLERENKNVQEKQEIANIAKENIYENDKIFIDASTTSWYLSKKIPNIPLTILTNSIKVILELSKKNKIRVISSGGTLLSRSLSFVGPLAVQALNNYHADKSFISCGGFHPEYGVSDFDENQTQIKKIMIENAQEKYLLVDYTKLNKHAFVNVSSIDKIDKVIINDNVDTNIVNQFTKEKINIIHPD